LANVVRGGQTLSDQIPVEDKQKIDTDIDLLQQEYSTLSHEVQLCAMEMQAWLAKQQQFYELSHELASWLSSEEASEYSTLSTDSGDLSSRQDLFAKMKISQQAMISKQDTLRQLAELANELGIIGMKEPDITSELSLANLQKQFDQHKEKLEVCGSITINLGV